MTAPSRDCCGAAYDEPHHKNCLEKKKVKLLGKIADNLEKIGDEL